MQGGRHETATIRKYAAAMLRRLIGAAGVAAGLIGAQALAADITGAGRDVPVSDLRQVGGRVQEIDRHRAQLPVDRLGRRDQADHREDGGFRRLGHAAQARGARQERNGPVSHGDWRRRAGGQPEGDRAGAAEAVGPAARRNLSGQDQEVERPGDRRAEPRWSACRRAISTWCTAPMAPAPPSSGRTTCRR